MKKNLINIIFLFLVSINLNAQQVVAFSHYFNKPLVYNPAYTGNDDAPNLMLANHTQWTGFKGGPQYNILAFDGSFINKNTGLGLIVYNDKKGLSNRIGGTLNYSYKIKFKDDIYVRLGLAVGAINQSYNFSKAITENQNDPSLFYTNQSKTSFDANAGLMFYCKGFELGAAAPQIANNKITYTSQSDSRIYYTQNPHYMASVKYKAMLSKSKGLSLSPLALIRSVKNTPMQYDANLNLDWKDKAWIGATYKSNYAIGLNLGLILFDRLSIGYSYDYITGNISKQGGLSHEIYLNFKFVKSKDKIAEAKAKEEAEDKLLKEMSEKDLNKILIERLLKKIDMVLDKDVVAPEEIHALLEEISSFLDGDSPDKKMQDVLNQYYKSLKQASGELYVLLKGKIIFDPAPDFPDYANVTITITDLGTKKVVNTCKPTLKDGKYYVILKPGRKYNIEVEGSGYQKLTRNFSPDGSIESYEMSQEIRLIK